LAVGDQEREGRLLGCLGLVVEDEPLVALYVEELLEKAGARVLLAHALATARVHARHSGFRCGSGPRTKNGGHGRNLHNL